MNNQKKALITACFFGLFCFCPAQRSRGALTVSIGVNFTGSTGGVISQALPPDPNGAIGPGRFMEFINGTVAVYNRTNGASVQRKTDLKFWADAGINVSAIAVSDPRVIFDPTVQRWFASQVDFDPNATDPTAEANDFLLAVSTTASPTGPWKAFHFQADPDNGLFADFPTLGVDANAVYLSGDFYSIGEVPEGPGLVSIPKADLIAETMIVPTPELPTNMTWYGVMDYSVRGEILQPAVCFDGSASGSIVSMGDIGYDSNLHSNMVWFAVQNAASASPTLTASSFLNIQPYQVPDNDISGVPQFTVLQPDGTSTLSANDARISARVYAVGGILYVVNNTPLNGRIAIRWYRIRAADHTLVEQGTIADAGKDLFFPSIAANQYGVVVIACEAAGSTTDVSSYAYAGETRNGTTVFGGAMLLKAGVDSYHDANELTYQLLHDLDPTYPLVNSRWGDYGTVTVDPADPTQFWIIQMYPSSVDPGGSGVGVWSTQITQLFATTPPPLAIAPAGGNVLVSWPYYASGYQLQYTSNLTSAAGWSLVPSSLSTNGLVVTATIPGSAAVQFFRLKSP